MKMALIMEMAMWISDLVECFTLRKHIFVKSKIPNAKMICDSLHMYSSVPVCL